MTTRCLRCDLDEGGAYFFLLLLLLLGGFPVADVAVSTGLSTRAAARRAVRLIQDSVRKGEFGGYFQYLAAARSAVPTVSAKPNIENIPRIRLFAHYPELVEPRAAPRLLGEPVCSNHRADTVDLHAVPDPPPAAAMVNGVAAITSSLPALVATNASLRQHTAS